LSQSATTHQENVLLAIERYTVFVWSAATGIVPSGTAQNCVLAGITQLLSPKLPQLLSQPSGTAALNYFLSILPDAGQLFNILSKCGVVPSITKLFGAQIANFWKRINLIRGGFSTFGSAAETFNYWAYDKAPLVFRVCKDSNGHVVSCAGSFWGGTYTITNCSEPVPDIGTLPGCGYVMFPPNGGSTTSGLLYFRGDNTEDSNIRWDYYVGGFTQVEVCSAETSSAPLDSASSFVYQTYADLIGAYPQNNITFTITNRTATAMGGTFTGNYQYPIAGPISNGMYPSATGTVSGTWTVNALPSPFPKCVVPAPSYICSDGYGAGSTNGSGNPLPCTFTPITDPAPPGEWQTNP